MTLGVSTDGRLPRVPNQPRTPLRSFRVSNELYQAVKAKAEEKGETVTDVVIRAFKQYLRSK